MITAENWKPRIMLHFDLFYVTWLEQGSCWPWAHNSYSLSAQWYPKRVVAQIEGNVHRLCDTINSVMMELILSHLDSSRYDTKGQPTIPKYEKEYPKPLLNYKIGETPLPNPSGYVSVIILDPPLTQSCKWSTLVNERLHQRGKVAN